MIRKLVGCKGNLGTELGVGPSSMRLAILFTFRKDELAIGKP